MNRCTVDGMSAHWFRLPLAFAAGLVAVVTMAIVPDTLAQPPLAFEPAPQQTVWVTTTDGRTAVGRFRAWTESGLDWETPDGIRRTSIQQIARIETKDPISDGVVRGTWAGAAIGGAYGLTLGLGLSCRGDCGADYSRTRDILNGVLSFALVGAGVGVALGAGVDAAIHPRRLVYVRASTLTLTPTVGVGRVGVAGAMRW